MSKKVLLMQLFKILKSAYGFAEAPCLWYLLTVELMSEVGMQELKMCRATFVFMGQERGLVIAVRVPCAWMAA